MVLLSDKHPIDLTIGQELPPTFHYAWVILPSQSRVGTGGPWQRASRPHQVLVFRRQNPDSACSTKGTAVGLSSHRGVHEAAFQTGGRPDNDICGELYQGSEPFLLSGE